MKEKISILRNKIQEKEKTPIHGDETAKSELRSLYWQLDELLYNEQSIVALSARTTSADATERMTKTFFKSIKPKNSKTLILTMKSPSGLAKTQKTITETICHFYENLYCEKPVQQPDVNRLINTITKIVPNSDYISMNMPISPQEVSAAIRDIASDKAPGPDGLGSEFYKTFAADLSTPLASVYQNCIETGNIPEFI